MKKHYAASLYALRGKEVLIMCLFVIGTLLGALYAISIRNNEAIFFAVNQYLLCDTDATLNLQTAKNSIILHAKQLISMWICGLFNVTRVVSFTLFFIIVFSYGFTMTSFILMYGVKGILIGVLTCGIQAVVIIFVGMYIMQASLSYTQRPGANNQPLKNYLQCLGIVIVGIAFSGLLDGFLYSFLNPIINLLL